MKASSIFRYGLIPWLFVVAFLYFDIIIRNAPSFMANNIMRDFKITSTSFGLLISMFAYPYAFMQIPVGMLLDRLGSIKVVTISACIVAMGTFMLGVSESFMGALIGRFLTGLGSASAFVSMVYVCTTYFPANIAASLTSFSNVIAMVGSMTMAMTTYSLLECHNWRTIHLYYSYIAALFFIVGVVILLFSIKKDTLPSSQRAGNEATLAGLLSFFKLDFLLNALSATFFFVNTGVFASMWAPFFFKQACGLSSSEIAFLIFLFYLGWIAGDILVGSLCYKVNRSKIVSITSFIAIFISFALFFLANTLFARQVLMLIMGLLSSGEIVQFNIATQYANENNLGFSIAFTNTSIAFFRACFASLFGFFLDYLTPNKIFIKGVAQYPIETWNIVTIFFPVSFIMAFLLNLLRRKKTAQILS